MHHAYSFALEYARSACCGDCTSTMLSRKGITFRDPEEARGDVSAGSDGVSGAGASGSVGGRARPRGGRTGPQMGAFEARRVRDRRRRAAGRDAHPAHLGAGHERGRAHRLSGCAAHAVRLDGSPGQHRDRPGRGGRRQLPPAAAAACGGRGHRRSRARTGRRPGRPLGLAAGGRRQAHLVRGRPRRTAAPGAAAARLSRARRRRGCGAGASYEAGAAPYESSHAGTVRG